MPLVSPCAALLVTQHQAGAAGGEHDLAAWEGVVTYSELEGFEFADG